MQLRQIFQNTFYQLLIIYIILVLLISISVFDRYSLQLGIFALILGMFGLSISKSETPCFLFASPKGDGLELFPVSEPFNIKKSTYILIFILSIFLIVLFRMIPYLNNNIPLGYDAGIYKYAVENGLRNLDNWILNGGAEPGFLYLMKPFSFIFSSQFILTYLLVFFCILLGIAIFLTTKEYFGKNEAIIALLIYSVSAVQFRTFWFMYYKNIIGLNLALFSIFFLKKYEKINEINSSSLYLFLFILLGGLLGSIHRPTFYIFGLTYFIYALISPYKNKKYDYYRLIANIISGLTMILIAFLFYLGKFSPAITNMFNPVMRGFLQPGEASGTFMNFLTYQFSILPYLPFAILGFLILIKRKQLNMIFLWTLITLVIVYFQFFFFNRFIIHLDIGLIIISSLGFSNLIENKKKIGIFILIILILSSTFIVYDNSINSRPLINQDELKTIKYLQNTEENTFVMATSSVYSPFVLGYSKRKTIAPGLFDYDKHNLAEWQIFWTTNDTNKIKEFLNIYPKPLYIFIGQQQNDNLGQFSECFKERYSLNNNLLYEYLC